MARASAGRWVARLLVALLALFVLVQAWFAAQVLWVRWQPPRETAFMAQRLAELREKDPKATIKFQWVPYERISTHLKRAVIAAEDAKFLEHEGFDWEGIAKAREKNERRGRVVAGGSTITQQLAKNLFLSPSKSYVRKGQEAIIALMLEAFLPKRRILELYLNVIEWGNGVFGAEAAAKRYFGVQAARLSAEQAARLAAMIPSPRRFERNPGSEYLDGRVATILARMPAAEVP
ncbi:MAG: monofunctional biosynthetic peptidoglycan transglycosylase [Betaproteobacteria bacterium]|nr:monofunctional biosynthetic peptidoglycan transglycosylase [Betaproteobacteria bacterium]